MKSALFISLSLILITSEAESRCFPPLASTNVDISDPIYHDIDKYVAAQLVPDYIFGDRPFSRREISRILGSVREHLYNSDFYKTQPDLYLYLRSLLERDQGNYDYDRDVDCVDPQSRPIFEGSIIDRVSAGYEATSGDRSIPIDNGLGILDAGVDPLNFNQEGRSASTAHAFDFESEHRFNITKYFAFFGKPRGEFLINKGSKYNTNIIVQNLYMKSAWRNFEIEVGRDGIEWGQRSYGGLLFSANARPLDMIKATNALPVKLPWIFEYLGPAKYSFFISNLGPHQDVPWEYLLGLRLSFQPHQNIEFAFQDSLMFGGKSSRKVKWYELPLDLVGIKQGDTKVDPRSITVQRAGWDGRVRFPSLAHMEWYFEAAFDDTGASLGYFLKNLSYSTGLYFPLLGRSGAMDFKIEFTSTSPPAFRNEDFGGHTMDSRVIGEPMGPDSYELLTKFGWDFDLIRRLNVTFAWLRRASDFYQSMPQSDGSGIRNYHQIDTLPKENSFRLLTQLDWRITDKTTFIFRTGGERVLNFNFLQGNSKFNYIAGAQLQLHPF